VRVLRFRGQSKNFYDAGQDGVLLQEFTSSSGKEPTAETDHRMRSSTFDQESRQNVPGVHDQATLTNEISSYLFHYLAGFHIPTHFIEKASPSAMLVKHLTMIPLVVQVQNTAMGASARRLGLKEGTELNFPVIEHYYKRPDLGHPLVNEFHIYARGIATPEQLRVINRLASKTNIVLRSFFERRGLKLQGLSLEFGMAGDQIVIGDEISPRTCKLAYGQKRKRTVKTRGAAQLETLVDLHSRLCQPAEGNVAG